LVVCHGTSLRGIVKHVGRELTVCCHWHVQWRALHRQGVGHRLDWSNYVVLRRDTVYSFRKVPTFQRSLLPPSSFNLEVEAASAFSYTLECTTTQHHTVPSHHHSQNQHMYDYIESCCTLTPITVRTSTCTTT
jgi:hypothetical protein